MRRNRDPSWQQGLPARVDTNRQSKLTGKKKGQGNRPDKKRPDKKRLGKVE